MPWYFQKMGQLIMKNQLLPCNICIPACWDTLTGYRSGLVIFELVIEKLHG